MRVLLSGVLVALLSCVGSATAAWPGAGPRTLIDRERDREVPVHLYLPAEGKACVSQKSCPVTFISPGHGVPHTSYSFIGNALAEQGHFVVAIQHDLRSDPPLTGKGDLVTVRTPGWQRGAATLRFVKAELSRIHPDYDWSSLTLVGHSNGGDISSLLLRDAPGFARRLITLDNRRVPLPRDPAVRVLSIRGSDFEADPGVLPSEPERVASGICIVEIPGSRHNDMHDEGPPQLRSEIDALVRRFLQSGGCGD